MTSARWPLHLQSPVTVLGSVAIIGNSRGILGLSMALGAVAFVLMLNGFFLFFDSPFWPLFFVDRGAVQASLAEVEAVLRRPKISKKYGLTESLLARLISAFQNLKTYKATRSVSPRVFLTLL